MNNNQQVPQRDAEKRKGLHPGDAVLQETLSALHASKANFSVYLVNGIKLEFDTLIACDEVCIKAFGNTKEQVVLRSAISTIVPQSTTKRG